MTAPSTRRSTKETLAPRVVVTWPGFESVESEAALLLRAAGFSVVFDPQPGRTSEDMVQTLAGATGAIVSSDPIDAGTFAVCPDLRVIARTGVGLDSIDVEAATRHGVVVTTTPGANDQTCADHTLAMMLAAVRRLDENDAEVRGGGWSRAGDLTGSAMYGTCVGLIGFGRIGRAVARRLRGFDVRLLVCDPAVSDAEGAERVDLDALLAQADIVSLHVPLTPATTHLLGETQLRRMRPGAILVNTARGLLVDEEALVRALGEGRLRAAALDVFSSEPPANRQLLDLPNVVLSPHIAGLSTQSIRSMTMQATRAVLDVLAGRLTPGVVNPEAMNSRERVRPVNADPQ